VQRASNNANAKANGNCIFHEKLNYEQRMIFWCRLPLQFPAASDHTETGLCPYCNHQRTCISAGNHWKWLFASSWGTPDSWHHWHCRCTRRGMGLPYHESHSTGCNPHSTQTPQIHSSIFRNLNHTVFMMPGKTLSSGYKKEGYGTLHPCSAYTDA